MTTLTIEDLKHRSPEYVAATCLDMTESELAKTLRIAESNLGALKSPQTCHVIAAEMMKRGIDLYQRAHRTTPPKRGARYVDEV